MSATGGRLAHAFAGEEIRAVRTGIWGITVGEQHHEAGRGDLLGCGVDAADLRVEYAVSVTSGSAARSSFLGQ